MTVSENDRDILARSLWGEARGESLAGQIAVAWTIRNRVNDGKTKSWWGEQLNRTSDIAEIRPAGMPLDAVPLPPLLDARISGMATNAFTLSGLEEIDGCLYAQSWWCREV